MHSSMPSAPRTAERSSCPLENMVTKGHFLRNSPALLSFPRGFFVSLLTSISLCPSKILFKILGLAWTAGHYIFFVHQWYAQGSRVLLKSDLV